MSPAAPMHVRALDVEPRYPADLYNPAADLTVEHSGGLVDYDLSTLRGRAGAGVAAEPGQRR